jgi:hypothetical protein
MEGRDFISQNKKVYEYSPAPVIVETLEHSSFNSSHKHNQKNYISFKDKAKTIFSQTVIQNKTSKKSQIIPNANNTNTKSVISTQNNYHT